MRKIISLGLVFAMCIGLAGCGDNAKYNLKDAKTCTIEGISFQYPKEWEATDIKTSSIDGKKSIDFKYNDVKGLQVVVDSGHTQTKDETLESFKQSTESFKIAGSKDVQELGNTTVAGYVCYHIKTFFYNGSTSNGEYYFFDSPKGMVEFFSGQEDALQILPKILKTVTISQSKYNLKDTETCNIEGISFKYPKEWEASDVTKTQSSEIVSFYQGNENGDDKKLLLYVTVLYDTTKESQMDYEKSISARMDYKKSISASTANTFKILDNIDVAGQVCYHIYKYYGEISTGYMKNGNYYFFDSPKGMVQIFSGQGDVLQILPDILKTVTIEQ